MLTSVESVIAFFIVLFCFRPDAFGSFLLLGAHSSSSVLTCGGSSRKATGGLTYRRRVKESS